MYTFIHLKCTDLHLSFIHLKRAERKAEEKQCKNVQYLQHFRSLGKPTSSLEQLIMYD